MDQDLYAGDFIPVNRNILTFLSNRLNCHMTERHLQETCFAPYLAKAYSYIGDSEKMIEVVEENYRRNPDYP